MPEDAAISTAGNSTKGTPFIDVEMASRSVEVEDCGGGEIILRNPVEPVAYPVQLGLYLRQHAAATPERTFLAERGPEGEWRHLSYGDALAKVNGISQYLIDHGYTADRPVAVFSDNSVNFALLMMGAMQIGIPFLPVSPAYSLMSQDFAKIKYVRERFAPALIYAAALAPFAKALKSIDLGGIEIVTDKATGEIDGVTEFDAMTATTPGPAVDAAFDAVNGDTVAKILLTSGSTGLPKGVINTQRMICFSGAVVDQMWPFMFRRPPVLCD